MISYRFFPGACFLLLLLVGTAVAAEPGTVTWATGYPKAVNSVLPNPTGGIKAFGDYTENAGYAMQGVTLYYAPKGSGTPVGTTMTPNGGKWGKKNANDLIVEYELKGVAKGTYNVWVSAIYFDTVNNTPVGIIGDFHERTIK